MKDLGLWGQIRDQEGALAHLTSALKQEHLFPTLIFVGPEGVGRKMAALGLLQKLICADQGCGQCAACRKAAELQSEALLHIAPTGQTIKVEEARRILDFISLKPVTPARMVLIESAHLMNVQMANALLKSFEEPPERTYFVLITSNLHAVLPTIRSRAQLVRFRPLRNETLSELMGASGWRLLAARGSLEDFKRVSEGDISDLRKRALDWLMMIYGEGTLPDFREAKLEKDEWLFVVRIWEQIFRDALVYQMGERELLNPDSEDLVARLSALTTDELLGWHNTVVGLQMDIMGQIDRNLALDVFAQSLSEQR